jgi:hypothetical protein
LESQSWVCTGSVDPISPYHSDIIWVCSKNRDESICCTGLMRCQASDSYHLHCAASDIRELRLPA